MVDTEKTAHQRDASFDTKRKEAEREAAANVENLRGLKRVADTTGALKGKRKKKGGGNA